MFRTTMVVDSPCSSQLISEKKLRDENLQGTPTFTTKLQNSILSRTALSEKRNDSLKNATESEVIAKIVMGKFKHILNYYYQRSFTRLKFGKKSIDNSNIDNDKAETNVVEIIPPAKHEEVLERNPEVATEEYFSDSLDESVFLASIKASTDEISQMASEELKNGGEEGVFVDNVDYDSDAFLQAALGEELYSSIDESWLEKSKDILKLIGIPIQWMASLWPDFETAVKNISEPINRTNEDHSVCTAEISQLVSRAGSTRSTFSKFRRLSDRHLTSSPICEQIESNTPYMSLDCKASDLIQEAAIQHQVIIQISKALNIILNTKEFKSSTEYIEAEKILLVAEQKREAVLGELRKALYESVDNMTCLGEVDISNLTFKVADESEQTDGTTQWFVAIVSHENTVLATEVTTADSEGNIHFQKSFRFKDLSSDFDLTVSIYSLSVENNLNNYSHNSKFHIKKHETTCLSPSRFSSLCKNSNKHQRIRYSYERRHPSFVLWGTTKIRIADLNKRAPLMLSQIPTCSTLQETFTAQFSSSVELNGDYSGFLTIGSEVGGYTIWSRRWCHLHGDKLKYWNYPAEQELCEPIGNIDLGLCVTSHISRADRELCARPRTLFLETGSQSTSKDCSTVVSCRSSFTSKRYYLSADNVEEMNIWSNNLNSVVSAIRNWNSMKCQLYFKK